MMRRDASTPTSAVSSRVSSSSSRSVVDLLAAEQHVGQAAGQALAGASEAGLAGVGRVRRDPGSTVSPARRDGGGVPAGPCLSCRVRTSSEGRNNDETAIMRQSV